MNRSWILWQAVVPLLGPVIFAAIILELWSTGRQSFEPNYSNFIDSVSPWALTFYCVTLIGSTMHTFWPKRHDHPGLEAVLIAMLVFVGIYTSFIAVWNNDGNFIPNANVYTIALILLGLTIVLCHWAYSKSQ